MIEKDYVIGIDLGGTKILTMLVDQQGDIIAKVKRATEADKEPSKIIDNLKQTVVTVTEQAGIGLDEVKGIGLGAPGLLDLEQGAIIDTPNLNLKGVQIVEQLKEFGPAVFLENDANAAAIAEKWFGAGRDVEDLVYVTVSTGIGGGIIVNGEVCHGLGNGGEIGHMTIDPTSKLQCSCGNYGCWEVLASGTALARRAKEVVISNPDTLLRQMVEDIEQIDGAIVAEAARKGDLVAQGLMTELAEYVGLGLANLITIFNPEKIVLGGGVSKSWELLKPTVEETISKRVMKPLLDGFEIVVAQLGTEAGGIGAATIALLKLELI
ncbi:ROK family protein [Natroniella sulfidigena]|uniref:ROK family protein n=1 Tax=Natroniella sulfidigena TaxID=723921 RepID=UPI00200A582C|nr:ROK family protein [Natroniella sulfidigena]MCK8817202.1 ROK family protein [Natroniella sulfidigena]